MVFLHNIMICRVLKGESHVYSKEMQKKRWVSGLLPDLFMYLYCDAMPIHVYIRHIIQYPANKGF